MSGQSVRTLFVVLPYVADTASFATGTTFLLVLDSSTTHSKITRYNRKPTRPQALRLDIVVVKNRHAKYIQEMMMVKRRTVLVRRQRGGSRGQEDGSDEVSSSMQKRLLLTG